MKSFQTLGGIFGALAVMLGAFGAHALKARLSPEHLQTFETAVRYQMYHALALFAAAHVGSRWAGRLFVAGILLFSGSLYGLIATGWRWLGPITPLGGSCLIAGWVALTLAAARR